MQPIYDFGGSGPLLHLAIANGFPPPVYLPFVRPLLGRYHVMSLPPRALWPDEQPPAKRLAWNKTLAVDLMNGMREHDLREVIAVGHSFGGIASLLAVLAEPERFKALILLDPTILPQRLLWTMRLIRAVGSDYGNTLAQRTDKRRDTFESTQAAYENLKGKRLFADWDDEALRQYAESMRPVEGGVKLAWPREWEAFYFRTLYTGTWGELPKLRRQMQSGLPVLIIRGGTSDTLLAESAARIRALLPGAAYAEIAGHGHLFPQSAPAETAQIIQNWLTQHGL
ncbi:MAG: alpha/beta hydrolase [Anaerolineae bacterium]